LKKNSQENR